ncbi:hypothetical protein bpSLO_001092 (plasmid) [Borrelia parkeri]|uniref:hypothetical protein n=1 Tax=Borrelia parkeri TaxID=141 RepID=UPI001FF2501B|nr:hypothetical protein [Borrelia parkeri]UPA11246.1 hypothetical protein bpSLO_001092 [Borrelia parkeri]
MKKICVILGIFFISFIVTILFYNFLYNFSDLSQRDIEVRDKACSVFNGAVKIFSDEFNNAITNFQQNNHNFNISFYKFIPVFQCLESKINVYDAFGYDATVSKRLANISERLDLSSDYTDGDTKIVYDLLCFLEEFREPIDEILNGHPSDANLIGNSISRNVGIISIITFNLKRAMAMEKESVSQVMGRNLAIDLASGKQNILQKLKNIIDDGMIKSSVPFVREMSREDFKDS